MDLTCFFDFVQFSGTPLYLAVKMGQKDIVSTLVERGAVIATNSEVCCELYFFS
jgi:ankyrin repeat protein